MCFSAFMRNCMYQYVMGFVRDSLHVQCKDLERDRTYSQGDSETKEWREGRLELLILELLIWACVLKISGKLGEVYKGKSRNNLLMCFHCSETLAMSTSDCHDGISHPANFSVILAAKQPSNGDLGSMWTVLKVCGLGAPGGAAG